jgi:mannose-6-phosphate isomerase-like protein (cupin superfamily)
MVVIPFYLRSYKPSQTSILNYWDVLHIFRKARDNKYLFTHQQEILERESDNMVSVAVLNLNDPNTWNRWIVGTPEDVSESSPFYSEQIQIAFVNNPERGLLEKGKEHCHKPPIEEYYLVLEGTLKVKVQKETFTLMPMQILKVPPMKRHKIIDYSIPIRFFTIRAPISMRETKIASK